MFTTVPFTHAACSCSPYHATRIMIYEVLDYKQPSGTYDYETQVRWYCCDLWIVKPVEQTPPPSFDTLSKPVKFLRVEKEEKIHYTNYLRVVSN